MKYVDEFWLNLGTYLAFWAIGGGMGVILGGIIFKDACF